jgi:hypothetical protein
LLQIADENLGQPQGDFHTYPQKGVMEIARFISRFDRFSEAARS